MISADVLVEHAASEAAGAVPELSGEHRSGAQRGCTRIVCGRDVQVGDVIDIGPDGLTVARFEAGDELLAWSIGPGRLARTAGGIGIALPDSYPIKLRRRAASADGSRSIN